MILGQPGHTVRDALKDLESRGPVLSRELVGELDAVLAACFADAQAKVPVDTGALKASGRFGGSVRDGGDTWVGGMGWGGETVAAGDVDYAVYVMATTEGDWLRDTHVFASAMERAIDAHLARYFA